MNVWVQIVTNLKKETILWQLRKNQLKKQLKNQQLKKLRKKLLKRSSNTLSSNKKNALPNWSAFFIARQWAAAIVLATVNPYIWRI